MQKTILLFTIILSALLMLQGQTVTGQNIVVTSNGNSGTGTLRNAITDVGEGDTITFTSDMTITLVTELTIGAKSLTINGTGKNILISGNTVCRIFNITGVSGKTYTINGLTIANGNTSGSGGGVYAKMTVGTLNVTNCTIRNNSATAGAGGGVSTERGGTFTNCTIHKNSGLYGGGARSELGGTFINCVFSANYAPQGGGAYPNSGGAYINCTFSKNTASNGGGVYTWGGGTFSNCIFWNNTSNEIYANGSSYSYCAVKSLLLAGTGNANLTVSPFVNDTVLYLNKTASGGLLCWNTGDNASNPSLKDIAGNPRKAGRIDIGAFEYINLPPSITSFSPVSGPIGTSVTITGSNFNTTAADNIVFFGATKATVTAATATTLTVTVPAGASYQNISVTDIITTLTAYSSKPFVTTFNCGGAITASSFITKADFATGSFPESISAVDVDGDGKPDLVIINTNTINTVSVFRNTSTAGAVSFAAKIDFTIEPDASSLSIGDLDGDGKPDLVVANNSNTVSILHNTSTTGSVSFATKKDFITGSSPWFLSIGDLDGDGKPELAVANYSSGTISVLRNTSTPDSISFTTKMDFATGTNPWSVSIGDLDNDGKSDMAIVNAGDGTVSVLRNTCTSGTISFATKVDFAAGSTPQSISISDLDNDGKPDLAVSNYIEEGKITLLRNTSTTGTVSFAAKVDYPTGNRSANISIGDMDGDGKPDLAVANYWGNTVSILHNNCTTGTFSFAAKVDYTTGSYPRSLSICDLDGNGKPDLAVTNRSESTISVFRNIVEVTTAINRIDTTIWSGADFSIVPVNGINGVVATNTTYTWPAPTVTGEITGGVAGSGASITGALNNPTASSQTATYTVTPGCSGNPFTINVTLALPPLNLVTSKADNGAGTLRWAIANVAEGSTITFASDMTITLANELVINNKSLTIDGTGKNITISGNNTCRVINLTGTSGRTNNFIALNIANGKTTDSGGGISASSYEGILNVTNCNFNANTANTGGGLKNAFGGTFTNCTFANNRATSPYYGGGGVSVSYDTPVFTKCTFSGNSAANEGGGVQLTNGGAFTSCIFNGNSARYGGGAYSGNGGTFINCSIKGNSASTSGGGIYATSYSLSSGKYTNCTFSGNYAGESGGGLYSTGGAFTNCLFWNSTSSEIAASGAYVSFNYCAVRGGYTGTGAGTGIVNLTTNPFVSDADLRLNKTTSGGLLCIDAGLNSANTTAYDILGQTRIQNGTIDMGAYEWTPFIPQKLSVDQSISSADPKCFNAYDTITVAGTSTVTFESGSSAELIAGKSIRFLPGFYAESGSFMYAHITTDSSFCNGASGSIVQQPVEKSIDLDETKEKQAIVNEIQVKVYPNPNNGQFKVAISGAAEERSEIQVYNLLGKIIYSESMANRSTSEISINNALKGLYILKVTTGKESFLRKIIIE